jgi:hypothetical protein
LYGAIGRCRRCRRACTTPGASDTEKALALQASVGPVFDVAGDCEDGPRSARSGALPSWWRASSPTDNSHARMGRARALTSRIPRGAKDLEIIIGESGDASPSARFRRPESAAMSSDSSKSAKHNARVAASTRTSPCSA